MDLFAKILQKICDKQDLSPSEAIAAMDLLMQGKLSPSQTGALLASLKTKGETEGEIAGFASVMRRHCVKITPKAQSELVDTCGTGGDFSQSFNVSTASAIIASSCGVPVAKHGNRSATSKCGSADVLEALGFNINMAPKAAADLIDSHGFGFLFAPLYHPSMKFAAPVRKELGIKTVFNLLGPLSNPAMAQRQLVGVYDEKLCNTIASALSTLGCVHGLVVHGDGLDELTVTGESFVCEVKDGKICGKFHLIPEEFGFARAQKEELEGGDAAQNAQILLDILSCKDKGAKRDMSLLNAGAAIYVGKKAESISEGVLIAEKSVDSGKALMHLKKIVSQSQII